MPGTKANKGDWENRSVHTGHYLQKALLATGTHGAEDTRADLKADRKLRVAEEPNHAAHHLKIELGFFVHQVREVAHGPARPCAQVCDPALPTKARDKRRETRDEIYTHIETRD
jgi:hypothetical protein